MPRNSLLVFLGWVFACNLGVATSRNQAAGGKHFGWELLAGLFLLLSVRNALFVAPGPGLPLGLLISNFGATVGPALARNSCHHEFDMAVFTFVGSRMLAGSQTLPLIRRDLFLTVRPRSV